MVNRSRTLAATLVMSVVVSGVAPSQRRPAAIPVERFADSAHHWYDIEEGEKVITPAEGQQRHASFDIAAIADNILLYQKENGGWPKNYDMLAILTGPQRSALAAVRSDNSTTTFDNGATHGQIEYLAEAARRTHDTRYEQACLRGIAFVLAAQYPNGGWPQFYPDTSGYRKYITFNDGAMTGVLRMLQRAASGKPPYAFLPDSVRQACGAAFQRGLDCILRCQITDNGRLTAWCQQHDNADLHPQKARTFEPASICTMESAELTELLMTIEHPSADVVRSVQEAVRWFNNARIRGIRVQTVSAPKETWQYHSADFDRVVVRDAAAPVIWPRMVELGTGKPLFCNRDGKPVYTLAEVSRERRTGYGWYTYEPQRVLDRYPAWQQRHAKNENVLQRSRE